MNVKNINNLSTGDCLIKKDTGELCRITQIGTNYREKGRFRILFYFSGFVVRRDCMKNIFKNDDTMFFVRR